MRARKTLAAAATLVAAAGFGTLVAPSAALAVSASGLCGSGYHNIDSHQLKRNGTLVGTIYLSYNGSTDCVVTEKNTLTSVRTYVDAYVNPEGTSGNFDADAYYSYAGPIKATAPGVCIFWGGSVSGGADPGDSWYVAWDSPRSHCG